MDSDPQHFARLADVLNVSAGVVRDLMKACGPQETNLDEVADELERLAVAIMQVGASAPAQ